jgi:hypothetical protein
MTVSAASRERLPSSSKRTNVRDERTHLVAAERAAERRRHGDDVGQWNAASAARAETMRPNLSGQ